MEKAKTVISDALSELGAYASETHLSSTQAQKGIFYLNAMMLDFDNSGINLGYTLIDSLGDDITIPDGALEPVVMNLAVMLSPLFNESATSVDLFIQAQSGYNDLMAISVDEFPNTPYPETMIRGSGNYSEFDRLFYTNPRPAIYTERGASISAESNES